MGRRDRARSLFRRSDTPSAPLTTLSASEPASVRSSTASTSQPPPPSQPGNKFLSLALQELQQKERNTIEKYLAQDTTDISTAVDKAYAAATAHKHLCEKKRWTWEFRGRDIVLQDEADKITDWLYRFRSIGNVVANVDPMHVGLPWAGIRLLLEVAVSGKDQMAALLTGMNLAARTADRLKVYFDVFTSLPPTLATSNFETELVKMYAHVLHFIAMAIENYQATPTTRKWRALWQMSSLDNFENEWTRLELRADITARACERETNEDKRNLARLRFAAGAVYDSYAERDSATCLEGTRTQLLDQIIQWTKATNSKSIFWLCGKAGTGKSTIARTIAHVVDQDQHRLGATFFFKRGEGDRGTADLFVPTIADQLAKKIPAMAHWIAKALDEEPNWEKPLGCQFNNLVSQPLQHAVQGQGQVTPSDLVVIIDALDECEHDRDILTILNLLAQVEASTPLRLRIFVTSRPEFPIKSGFYDMPEDLHHDMVLEEVQDTTIESDIFAYFKHRFETIRNEDMKKQRYLPLPVDWPGEDNLQSLVDLAVPLFIFASTVCRYVAESNPRARLDQILQQRTNKSISGIEKVYLPILNQLVLGKDGTKEQNQVLADFQNIVGAIVLFADPLSALSMSKLLDISLEDVFDCLQPLHSVLSIPKDSDAPIRLLHLSFRSFLVDADEGTTHQSRFRINESGTQRNIATHCLRLLCQPGVLKDDLCDLSKPGTRRVEIKKSQITRAIPAEVVYACQYWVSHLAESKEYICDHGHVHDFLKTHFLHWMEALSWLGRLSGLMTSIRVLQSLVDVDHGSQLHAFLADAARFVPYNRHVVDLVPLQLYSSALIFTPRLSVIRQNFESKYSTKWKWPRTSAIVPSNWSYEIQQLEILGRDTPMAHTIAFSPDGQVIVAAYGDESIVSWDTMSGERIRTVPGRSRDRAYRSRHSADGHHPDTRVADHVSSFRMANAITFSPNGSLVPSNCYDSVPLWDAKNAGQVRNLDRSATIGFSPDGQVAASELDDFRIVLWRLTTGELLHTFGDDNHWAIRVVFSPDGKVIASTSLRRATEPWTLTLWCSTRYRKIRTLVGHRRVAFSPCGTVMASIPDPGSALASAETTEWYRHSIVLSNVMSGDTIQTLDMRQRPIVGVAFSPDGRVIVSATSSRVIIWDATSHKALRYLEQRSGDIIAMTLSPDGCLVALGCDDGTVRLWDLRLAEQDPSCPSCFSDEDTWEAHTALSMSPNGQVVAPVSCRGLLRL